MHIDRTSGSIQFRSGVQTFQLQTFLLHSLEHPPPSVYVPGHSNTQ